jgi:hypothetical protein
MVTVVDIWLCSCRIAGLCGWSGPKDGGGSPAVPAAGIIGWNRGPAEGSLAGDEAGAGAGFG